MDYFILVLLVAAFGYTTGVLKYLSNRIDILYGLVNHITTNEITHLHAAVDKLMERYKEKESEGR